MLARHWTCDEVSARLQSLSVFFSNFRHFRQFNSVKAFACGINIIVDSENRAEPNIASRQTSEE